jgi:hypothetical protein
MEAISTTGLLPITFDDLNVPAREEKDIKEGKTEDKSEEAKFNLKLNEIRGFVLKSKLPGFQEAWQQTVESFVKAELPSEYEDSIYAALEGISQFEWRYKKLIRRYEQLAQLYDATVDVVTEINKLSSEIFNRQNELYVNFSKLSKEDREGIYERFSFETIFSHTFKHILKEGERDILTTSIGSIYDENQADLYLKLRYKVCVLPSKRDSTKFDEAFEEVKKAASEITKQNMSTEQIKKIYEIFSLLWLD